MRIFAVVGLLAVGLAPTHARAEDGRTQYPAWLRNSYFDINVGYIGYPFSQAQLEPGHTVRSVQVPHPAVRLTLLGHNFTRHLSAQVTYTRPVGWVRYEGLDGTQTSRTVWMNIAGLTARGTLPLGSRFSAYAEGGLGIVTRHGFEEGGHVVVRNAGYGTVLLGTGLKYRLSRVWDLQASAAYTPPNDRFKQPHTVIFSGGGVLNMRPRSPETVAANAQSGAIFPKHLVQVGYTTNGLGTGVNGFFTGTVPIFWGGHVHVSRGIHGRYQRNVFHTAKLFSLDVGVSVGGWQTDGERFTTVSAYPLFRFTPVRTKVVDLYLFHSVAGPTFISKKSLDGYDTGRRFTFQDLMGMGAYIGNRRKLNLEASIGHYSNGNIFPRNAGVKIPLTFTLGYAF